MKKTATIFPLVFLTITFTIILAVSAQGSNGWTKTLMNGAGESVIQTADGGYVVTGQTEQKAVLIKTTSDGNIEWFKTYGEIGAPFRSLSIVQTIDGGYAVGCLARSGFDFFKTDSTGNMQWSKGFFYGLNNAVEIRSVIQTSDEGFFLAGGSANDNSGFIVKTDKDGNMQWNRTLTIKADSLFLRASAQTSDDGFLLGGKYLFKVDSLGNYQWNRTIEVSSICKSSDGGFVVISSSLEVLKTDLNGNVISSVSYSIPADQNYTSKKGVITKDGGYAFAGTIPSSYPMAEFYHGYVSRLNSTGMIAWVKEYSGNNMINSLIYTNDDSFVIAGTNPYTLTGENNSIWLEKTADSAPSISIASSTPSSTVPQPSININQESTPTPSPSPSVPEFSWLTILPILLAIPIALITVRKRLQRNV